MGTHIAAGGQVGQGPGRRQWGSVFSSALTSNFNWRRSRHLEIGFRWAGREGW
jgi:hypothetical protein